MLTRQRKVAKKKINKQKEMKQKKENSEVRAGHSDVLGSLRAWFGKVRR